jgi:cell division protein FtsL
MASKKQKEKRRVDLLSMLLIVLLLTLVGWQLMSMRDKLDAATAEQAALEERVARQEQENRSLEAALERAEDPEYLQQLAREQLGMVTPGQKDFYDVSN